MPDVEKLLPVDWFQARLILHELASDVVHKETCSNVRWNGHAQLRIVNNYEGLLTATDIMG